MIPWVSHLVGCAGVLTLSQDEICLESSPKVVLQNKLARSRRKLQELESVLNAKREGAHPADTRLDSHCDRR